MKRWRLEDVDGYRRDMQLVEHPEGDLTYYCAAEMALAEKDAQIAALEARLAASVTKETVIDAAFRALNDHAEELSDWECRERAIAYAAKAMATTPTA